MSLPEIAHRIGEKAKKSLARGTLEDWKRYQCPGPVPTLPGLGEYLQTQTDTAWPAREAEHLLAGEFAALGLTWPPRAPETLFPPDLWRLDPVTGDLWPGADRYCFDIYYRHERGLGDIKYVWEINRLQFLQPLALHVRITGDAAALSAIEAAIESWYNANPPFRGLGWNSGIELGLRAISLLVVTTLCGDRMSPSSIERIRTILHAHLFWIDRYPSRFSSANNHLIAEAAGAFLVALAMSDLPQANRIEAESCLILAEEAEKQFYGDGTPAEQSPNYGAFSAELLWLCDMVAEASGKPLADTVQKRLNAFAGFVFWASYAKGKLPAIGDDDEGFVLKLGPAAPSYSVSVCQRFSNSSEGQHQGLSTFHEGGYTFVKERRSGRSLHLTFDHGPLGYLSIAAHGHADALALVVSLDGVPLFVDPGTYLYHSGGAWRDWFRGTPAHNTLNIHSTNQSHIVGPFNWSSKAESWLEEVIDGEEWSIIGAHDGYLKTFGVVHRRKVFAQPDGFAIQDWLVGGDDHSAEVVFQLSSEWGARQSGKDIILSHSGSDMACLQFNISGDVTLAKGGEIGDGGGWVSPSFGVKQPAVRVAWRGKISDSGLITRLRLLN